MDKDALIEITVAFVKETLAEAEAGHDWFHIQRVWNNTKLILQSESEVDTLVVQLGALLHDIADSKFHDGDEEIGPKTAGAFLASHNTDPAVVKHVENIVRYISFKGSLEEQQWMSPELAIVQDADRLDALGAIGIARAFTYGGYKDRPLYDPALEPNLNMSKEEYKNAQGTTINHFYEKLLLLKDKMNTETGKRIAQQRHEYVESYIAQFKAEWEGKR